MYPTFFGNYANAFQVAANQSTEADLEKNDLQIGKGTVSNTASSVDFSGMVHAMGLAHLVFSPKSVAMARLLKSDGTTLRDISTTTIYAVESFTPSGYKLANSTNSSNAELHNYLCIGNPHTGLTFTPDASSTFTWSNNSTSLKSNDVTDMNITSAKQYKYRSTSMNAYGYTGNVQTFTATSSTLYLMECWGASGSDDPYGKGAIPGKGGYVAGTISFNNNTPLYIYVGGQGTSLYNHDAYTNAGGWNGGGFSTANTSLTVGGGGGGSTDIRIIKHSDANGWSGTASLRSRIFVAGGGGGCESPQGVNENGGNAGGLIGASTPISSNFAGDNNGATGGTQTSGGIAASHLTETANFMNEISSGVVDPYGHFGYASQVSPSGYTWWSGGAGGGWYGGANGHGRGGAGGSSFISGMTECVAITSDGTQTSGVTTMTINGTTYSFSSPIMKGGGESMPKHDGTSGTMTGNYGNGYAIITQLSY